MLFSAELPHPTCTYVFHILLHSRSTDVPHISVISSKSTIKCRRANRMRKIGLRLKLMQYPMLCNLLQVWYYFQKVGIIETYHNIQYHNWDKTFLKLSHFSCSLIVNHFFQCYELIKLRMSHNMAQIRIV